MEGRPDVRAITTRPYQLLCTVCSLGEGRSSPEDEKLRRIVETVRRYPDVPTTLRCNVADLYSYQSPGTQDDTPGGADYNSRRDLEILHRLDLAPGSTLPARTLYVRLLERITTVRGICSYGEVTSDIWRGCPKATRGYYEKGVGLGIQAIIPPRGEAEMASARREAVAEILRGDVLTVRPHILLCALCEYHEYDQMRQGLGSTLPHLLFECFEVIRKEPDTLIQLVPGADWMVCAPCPFWVPELSSCVNVRGSGGLTNALRDLRVLQILGLSFGDKLKAGDLCKLILERIPDASAVCGFDVPSRVSAWWDDCGERPKEPAVFARNSGLMGKDLGL